MVLKSRKGRKAA